MKADSLCLLDVIVIPQTTKQKSFWRRQLNSTMGTRRDKLVTSRHEQGDERSVISGGPGQQHATPGKNKNKGKHNRHRRGNDADKRIKSRDYAAAASVDTYSFFSVCCLKSTWDMK
jgi:hypothetical protein